MADKAVVAVTSGHNELVRHYHVGHLGQPSCDEAAQVIGTLSGVSLVSSEHDLRVVLNPEYKWEDVGPHIERTIRAYSGPGIEIEFVSLP